MISRKLSTVPPQRSNFNRATYHAQNRVRASRVDNNRLDYFWGVNTVLRSNVELPDLYSRSSVSAQMNSAGGIKTATATRIEVGLSRDGLDRYSEESAYFKGFCCCFISFRWFGFNV